MKTDDPIFTELALKAITGKASAAEQSQLKNLLLEPALADEFKQLQTDATLAKEVLPLLGEAPASIPPLSDFEYSQMKALVEKGNREKPDRGTSAFSWRWIWGVAAAAAVITMVVIFTLPAKHPLVQVAMLDSMGQARGNDDGFNLKLTGALQQNFGQTNYTVYSDNQGLNDWLKQQPVSGPVIKIVYDRDAGEVRIIYPAKDNQIVTKTFPVLKEDDLPSVLKKVQGTINAK